MALTASPPLPSPSSTLPTTRAAGPSSSSPSRPHYFELYPPGPHLPRLPSHPKKPKAGPSSRRKDGRLNLKEGQRIKREISPMRETKDGTKGGRMSNPTSNETFSASEPSRSSHPLARTPSLRSSPDQPSLPRPSHLCSSTETLDSSPSVSYPKRSSSLQPNSLPLPLASSQRRPLIQSAFEHDPPSSSTSSKPVMPSLPVSISSSSIDDMIDRMPNQLEEPWLDASSLGPPSHSASLRSSLLSSDLSSLVSSSSIVPRPPPSTPLRRLTSETLPSFPTPPPLRLEPASSASSPRPIIGSVNDIISNNINKEASRERTHPLPSAFSPPLNQSTFPAPQQVPNSSIVQSASSTVAHAANLSSLSDLTRTTPSTSRTSIASSSLSSNTLPSRRPALDLDHSLLLQSTRLNHLITLPNHDNLTVSFADVGCSSGIPVVLFLGLGGVRFLAELFSELAYTMGIRLICVDRWGLGKTDDVGTEKRGVLKWASVLTGVMDAMGIEKFGILAHSAGAPYALATATCFPERILGSVHLLAPWTGINADGGWRWLKIVPASIIKTSRAAEWQLQDWLLAAKDPKPLPSSPPFPSRTSAQPSSSQRTASSPSSPDFSSASLARASTDSYDDLRDFTGRFNSDPTAEEVWQKQHRSKPLTSRLRPVKSLVPSSSRPSSSNLPIRPSSSSSSASSDPFETSLHQDPSDPVRPSTSKPTKPTKPAAAIDLGTTLIRASHKENQGSTKDLLAVLRSDSWGFACRDVPTHVKIWWGDRDERVSEKGVRSMADSMRNCELRVLRGEGHNLLSSPGVVIDVFESIVGENLEWKGGLG